MEMLQSNSLKSALSLHLAFSITFAFWGHISTGPATLGAEQAKGRTACHSASAMLARQVSTKEVGTHKRGAQTSLADDVSGQFQLFCLGSSIGFESSRINVKQRGRLGLQVGNRSIKQCGT